MKLKKGDTVTVTAGKDKGKKGKILHADIYGERVTVEGINVYKKHLKKKDEKTPGKIVEKIRSLPVSNVMFTCPSCGKNSRLGYLITKNEKIRVCKKCRQKV